MAAAPCENAGYKVYSSLKKDIQTLIDDFKTLTEDFSFKALEENLLNMAESYLMGVLERAAGDAINEANSLMAETLTAVSSYATSAFYHLFNFLGNSLTPGALYILTMGQFLYKSHADKELGSLIEIAKEVRGLIAEIIGLLRSFEDNPYLEKFRRVIALTEAAVKDLDKASENFHEERFSRLNYDVGINSMLMAKSKIKYAMATALGVNPSIFDQFDPSSSGSIYSSSKEDYIFQGQKDFFKNRLEERAKQVGESFKNMGKNLKTGETYLPPQFLYIKDHAKNISESANELSWRASIVLPIVVMAADTSRLFKTYVLGFYDSHILKYISKGMGELSDAAKYILEKTVLAFDEPKYRVTAWAKTWGSFYPLFAAYQLIKIPARSGNLLANDKRLIEYYDMETIASGVTAFSNFIFDTVLGDVVSSIMKYFGADKERRKRIFETLNRAMQDMNYQINRMEYMYDIVLDIIERRNYILSVWIDYFLRPDEDGLRDQKRIEKAIDKLQDVLWWFAGFVAAATTVVDILECVSVLKDEDEADKEKKAVLKNQIKKTKGNIETQKHLKTPVGQEENEMARDKVQDGLDIVTNA